MILNRQIGPRSLVDKAQANVNDAGAFNVKNFVREGGSNLEFGSDLAPDEEMVILDQAIDDTQEEIENEKGSLLHINF